MIDTEAIVATRRRSYFIDVIPPGYFTLIEIAIMRGLSPSAALADLATKRVPSKDMRVSYIWRRDDDFPSAFRGKVTVWRFDP